MTCVDVSASVSAVVVAGILPQRKLSTTADCASTRTETGPDGFRLGFRDCSLP